MRGHDDLVDQDVFFDDVLSDREARRNLEIATRIGAEVSIDIATGGTLGIYLVQRRTDAKTALGRLIDADPANATEVATLQSQVKEYISVTGFIIQRLEEAKVADQFISEEYGDDGRNSSFDGLEDILE